MAYSPPAGNDVDVNFTASYSAPAGSDTDFQFAAASAGASLIGGRLLNSALLKGLL